MSNCQDRSKACSNRRINVLLGILIVLVTAVTYLNHYTTKVSTDYFREAQARAETDLFYSAVTQEAQRTVAEVAVLGKAFLAERDQARKYATYLYEKCVEFYDIVNSQSTYIEQLEEKLIENKIPLPTPKQ